MQVCNALLHCLTVCCRGFYVSTHLATGYSGFYFACRAYDLATGTKRLGIALKALGPGLPGLSFCFLLCGQWDEGRQVDIAIAAAVPLSAALSPRLSHYAKLALRRSLLTANVFQVGMATVTLVPQILATQP